jgi:Domain of unknown function (DUF5916)
VNKCGQANQSAANSVYLSVPQTTGVVVSSLALAVVLSGAAHAATAPAANPSAVIDAQAIPATTPMVLDGRLSEPVWEQSTAISEFVQRDPAEGAPPTQHTDARIAFDENAVYIGVRAHDAEADRIVGILTRRDQRSPSDWIRVVIDSYYDRRSAYEFGVNPVGVKTDRYYFNDGNSDDSWDAVWDVQVERDADGWTAEFRIPFSQLRFNNTDGGPVGFAVIREIGRLAETSSWPLLSRSATGFVSQFAEVRGLRMTGTAKKLELLPYSLGSVSTRPDDDNPLIDNTDPSGSLGLDLKYALRPGLTFTAAINPDFGQVEADPAVVNLDAFEVFFQERRPFFVESSGNFQFNMDCSDGQCTGLFYSRRIGRTPQGEADTAEDEYSVAPSAVTIIGAGKLTGRVGKFSIGALTALTAEEEATIASDTVRRTQVIEPTTGYTVVRARREFGNQSNVGFMLTSTNRNLVESVDFLAKAANTGGVDYDWRIGRRFNIAGYWAGSHMHGSTEAITRLQENNVHAFQRPDADYVEVDEQATTLRGHSGSIAVGKIGGEKTRFNAFYGYKSPGFDMNDLGFQRRADERNISHWFQWRDQVPGRFTRSFIWNLNQWAGWNFGGDRLFSGGNVNMHWTWKNYYSSGFGVNVNAAPLRDRVTRGGPAVLGNSSVGVWYYFNTDNRKAITVGLNGWESNDRHGTVQHNYAPFVNWRPTSALSVNASFRYNINNDDAQWVENLDADGVTHHVFGRLKQRTSAFTFRVNYTLTPTLSIQTYAEPFVSAGAYTNFRELNDPRAPEYADRYKPYAYADNPDFNFRSFRTTNVMRWEYKPGSTLFVVWQQGREDELSHGDFQFGRDFGGVFSAPARNVFLVKLSYWLNM